MKNTLGSDLRIKGNGFYSTSDPVYGSETIGGSFEPGIVHVGVGDSPETAQWYELAGSEYYTISFRVSIPRRSSVRILITTATS